MLDLNGSNAYEAPPADGNYAFRSDRANEVPVTGDWNGDGRTKMGVYADGYWLLDYNGNGVWDGPDIDKSFFFGGLKSDGYEPVVGDWNGNGKTKIGTCQNGYWLLDYDGNFLWDGPGTDKLVFLGGSGYKPVVGDWNGSGSTKIGAHLNGLWILDFNGNFAWDGVDVDKLLFFGGPGYTPVAGDWSGSGSTKIGAFLNGVWLLDYNGNFAWDGAGADVITYFGNSGWTPMVGNWNGVGLSTKVGAYIDGYWVLDVNGNFIWDPPADVVTYFGGIGYTPVVGAWTDFTLTTPQNTINVLTGVQATPTYYLTVAPVNGYSGPVSFSAQAFYGCSNVTFNPATVTGPPWTTTLSTSCYESLANTYYTTVTASSGGRSHQLNLYLFVGSTQQYSLTTTVNQSVGSVNPSGGWFNSGTTVPVTAVPSAGYQFTGFTGSLNSTSNPLSVTMNSPMTLTANFTATGGQPLAISSIQIPSQYLSTSAVTVMWTSNINSNSQIYWGTSASYTSYTTLDPTLTTSHQQFIVGLSPGTIYHYQARSTDQSGTLVTSQDLTFTTPATPPPVPSDFTNCISGTAATCPLNPGTYAVNSTINITRYGVTVSGGLADRKLTRLVRGAILTDPLVRVAVTDANGATLTMTQVGASQGIVVKDMTFCGGGNTDHNTTPEGSPAVLSGAGEPCGDQQIPAPTKCDYSKHCIDLSVDSVAVDLIPTSGHYPTNPFAYSGPYALELYNVDLEDAAGSALRLYASANTLGASPKKVNDIWIRYSAIHYSAITGILYGANFVRYDYSYCDEYASHHTSSFQDDPALFAPRNIRIEHNDFRYNNTGAMGGGAVRYVGLRYNTFFVNYIMPQAGNWGGGGIDFEPCADKIEISYNTITGPNSTTGPPPSGYAYAPFAQTSGLELYGRNINIHDNTFRGHGETGIGAWSLFYDPNSPDHEKISQNHVLQDNGWSGANGGIEIGNSFPFPACVPVPRDAIGVTVSANDSNPIDVNNSNSVLTTGSATQAYGVFLQDHGPLSTGRLKGVTVTADNFQGPYPLFHLRDEVFLDYFVGLYGYLGVARTNALPPKVDRPRVLPVSVTSASSSVSIFSSPPSWPTPPLCPDLKDDQNNLVFGPLPTEYSIGSPRAMFKFSASDAGTASSLNGASNVAAIWGIFSVGGHDKDGAGGPSAMTTTPPTPDQGVCDFVYDAVSDMIHIGDGHGGYLSQSPVGQGGQDLNTPGGCIIHGATSTSSMSPNNSQATPVEYVLDLILDVTLPVSPHNKYHIYSYTESRDYNWDGCDPNTFCPSWKYSGYWWNTPTTP